MVTDAVAPIHELCGRVPLALSIAAARAVNRHGFALAGLAAQLRATKLDALDAGDAAASVRMVFSWSYRNLSAASARIFRLLGLAPGPDISLPAAASLAGVPRGRARGMLTELARTHLLTEHVPGRFVCHDLLRAYAAEIAHEAEPPQERHAAIHRVLDHYLHTAVPAALLINPGRSPLVLGPPEPGVIPECRAVEQEALTWLRAEHAVLMGAIALAADAGFDDHAWRIAWTLSDFLYREGHWDDMLAAPQAAVTAARRMGDLIALAMSLRDLGSAHTRLDSYDRAHTQLQEALGLFGRLGDGAGQGRVHHDIGRVYWLQGCHADALSHAQQALSLFRAAGQRTHQAQALNAVGWCYAQLGAYEEALSYCGQALDLHRETGQRYGEAATLDSLGYAHHRLGDQEAAIDCYRLAIQLYQMLGDRVEEAATLVRLGDSHRALAGLAQAQLVWRQALSIFEDLNHPDAQSVRIKLHGLTSPS